MRMRVAPHSFLSLVCGIDMHSHVNEHQHLPLQLHMRGNRGCGWPVVRYLHHVKARNSCIAVRTRTLTFAVVVVVAVSGGMCGDAPAGVPHLIYSAVLPSMPLDFHVLSDPAQWCGALWVCLKIKIPPPLDWRVTVSIVFFSLTEGFCFPPLRTALHAGVAGLRTPWDP